MKTFQRYFGNWANCLEKLAGANPKQRFASVAEELDKRIKEGFYDDICQNDFFMIASFNEVNGRILATKAECNPLLDYSKEAVKAMSAGEFYLTKNIKFGDKIYAQVLEEIAEADKKLPIGKKRVIDLGNIQTHKVSTDCFGDDETIAFLAEGKRRANKYGLFLRDKIPEEYRLKEVNVYHQNLIGKNKSRGGWLY